MGDRAWFQDLDADDLDGAVTAIREGRTAEPAAWPEQAVTDGFVADEDEYYAILQEATVAAANRETARREQATDQQLVHAIRGIDDLTETRNELAERVAEWAGSQFSESDEGLAYVREVADREPETPVEAEIVDLAATVSELDARRAGLQTFVEEQAPAVAPNLTMLADPFLAARLIALAGGLKALAQKPSGTVQVLGAEDALFAHLEGHAPSPKHGIIFTHESVRGTRPADRGSAARAVAGKLAIAARIDYYRGERHEDLREDLEDRIETIQQRGEAE